MSDDLLERATAALRETSAEPEPRSGLTRARLLESAQKRSDGVRGAIVRWLVGLGAVLVAGTALAHVAPHLPELLQAVIGGAAEQEPPAPRTRHAGKARRDANPPPPARPAQLPETAPAAAPTVEAKVPALVPEVATQERASDPPPARARRTPPRAARRAPATVAQAPEPTAPAPAPAPESAELALFRRAQRLHLAHDRAAVDAWDDYLRVAARGVLVPEARYNRALALLRAGRKHDARAALEPFARGEYGAYRRAEARALLEAVAREASNP